MRIPASFLAGLSLCLSAVAGELREAPNLVSKPANQLVVSGNACGPTALLNAFRAGSPAWQRVAEAVPGQDDKQRILSIIRTYGMRQSSHLGNRPRWSRRGVNLADLTDIGGEMIHGRFLPPLSQEVFFLKPRETPEKLLSRVHRRFEKSLAKGLPPLLSIRRHALRSSRNGPPQWVVIEAHFVTVTAVPRKLPRNANSFEIRYIDPWGGKHRQGQIAIPANALLAPDGAASPCLEAIFPDASVGKNLARKGERTALAVSAGLGRW